MFVVSAFQQESFMNAARFNISCEWKKNFTYIMTKGKFEDYHILL